MISAVRQFLRQHLLIPPQFWILGLGVLFLLILQMVGVGWFWTVHPSYDQNALQNFIGTLAEVLASVLGFTISVVAIVVQLSADRFTPKVTELFLRERINFFVISFLIIANLIAVWTTLVFSVVEQPIKLISLNLVLGSSSFLILIPYFIFVFNFLQPASIIRKIEQQIRYAIRMGIQASCADGFIGAQSQCLSALDEIRGIAISAIRNRESLIILESLDSLKAFVLFYILQKKNLSPFWFSLSRPLYRDPDLVLLDQDNLKLIEKKKIWVELKVFRQYQAVFIDALNTFREACYIIGGSTREIAERSLMYQDLTLLELTIKFFNTYLRAVINTRDIRTGYNILKQYRQVGETAIQYKRDSFTLEIAQHFRYYSLLAYKAGLFFLCETFAYDLGILAQCCCQYHSPIGKDLLKIFLVIDQDPEGEQQEGTLRGIRKSQSKLAAYYLQKGEEDLARAIFEDMKHEPMSRLKIILEEFQTTPSEFWEFTDRGENFYYVDPNLFPFLLIFFRWFDHLSQDSLTEDLPQLS
jgi:hypothetical protein